MGMQMPSWFDIKSLDASADEDDAGIKAAAKNVHEWIEEEIKSGIPSSRILMGGFSQGGALALFSTFTFDKPLAGVVALSSWLPLHKELPGEHQTNKEITIFQAHGDADPLVRHAIGATSAAHIKAFNPNHSFKTYPGLMHSACDEEFQDMKKFIAERLPPQ
jgi:lysophospholipase-2